MEVEENTAKIPKKNFNPSDYQELDIMGNPIDEDVDVLRANCAKKLELADNTTFTICTVECYYTRPIFITAEMRPGDYLEEDLFIIDSNNNLRNKICTKIIF